MGADPEEDVPAVELGLAICIPACKVSNRGEFSWHFTPACQFQLAPCQRVSNVRRSGNPGFITYAAPLLKWRKRVQDLPVVGTRAGAENTGCQRASGRMKPPSFDGRLFHA